MTAAIGPEARVASPESEAVEALVQAALDILHHDRSEDSAATQYNRHILASRFTKILSVHADGEEMRERCAKVADIFAQHSDGDSYHAGITIASRIRSLSLTGKG